MSIENIFNEMQKSIEENDVESFEEKFLKRVLNDVSINKVQAISSLVKLAEDTLWEKLI